MSVGMIDGVIGMRTLVRRPLPYKIVRQAVRESLGCPFHGEEDFPYV